MEQNKNNSILVAVLFLIIGLVVGYMVAGNSVKNLPTKADDQAGKAISSQIVDLGNGASQGKYSNGQIELDYKPNFDLSMPPAGYLSNPIPNIGYASNLFIDFYTIKNTSTSNIIITQLTFNDDFGAISNGAYNCALGGNIGGTNNITTNTGKYVATLQSQQLPSGLEGNFGLQCFYPKNKLATDGIFKYKVSLSKINYTINGLPQTVSFTPISAAPHYAVMNFMSLKGNQLAVPKLSNASIEVANYNIKMNNSYDKGKWRKFKFSFKKDANLTLANPQIYQDGVLMTGITYNLQGGISGKTDGTLDIVSATDVDCSTLTGHTYSIKLTVGGYNNPGVQTLNFAIGSNNSGATVDYPKSYTGVLAENPSIVWTGYPNTGGAGIYFGDKETRISGYDANTKIVKTGLFNQTSWALN